MKLDLDDEEKHNTGISNDDCRIDISLASLKADMQTTYDIEENDNPGWFIRLIDVLPLIFGLLVVCIAMALLGKGN
jgi:hypothetical protein